MTPVEPNLNGMTAKPSLAPLRAVLADPEPRLREARGSLLGPDTDRRTRRWDVTLECGHRTDIPARYGRRQPDERGRGRSFDAVLPPPKRARCHNCHEQAERVSSEDRGPGRQARATLAPGTPRLNDTTDLAPLRAVLADPEPELREGRGSLLGPDTDRRTRWWNVTLECGHHAQPAARYITRPPNAWRRRRARERADVLPPPKRVRCHDCHEQARKGAQ